MSPQIAGGPLELSRRTTDASLGSFQNMLADYLDSGCTKLEFPDHLVSAIEVDPDRFIDTMALVYNRLSSVANDGTTQINTTAQHDSDLLLARFEPIEFAALWMAWRAFTLLITQSAAGQPLHMPHAELPHTGEGILAFTNDLASILRKTPAVKMEAQISGQRPN